MNWGDWFYSVAIFSFLLQFTGSAQLVAYAFFMQVLPQTLIAPAARTVAIGAGVVTLIPAALWLAGTRR